MVGIFKYENGLKFTGMIAENEETAKSFLAKKHGKEEEVFTGKFDKEGRPIYKIEFVPQYCENAYKIMPIIKID